MVRSAIMCATAQSSVLAFPTLPKGQSPRLGSIAGRTHLAGGTVGDQTRGRSDSMTRAKALVTSCVAATVIALGLGYWAIDSPQLASAEQAPAVAPASLAIPVTLSSPIQAGGYSPTTTSGIADQLRTRDETAHAYSHYVGEIQSQLVVLKRSGDVQSARLKRDYESRNLEWLESDAQTWREAAYSAEKSVGGVIATQNVSVEDGARFRIVLETAQQFILDYETMMVEISVNAHAGIVTTSELERDVVVATRAHQAFEKAVLDGYKHFGYARAQIDQATLQIK